MQDKDLDLRKAIKLAGGPLQVSKLVGRSERAVHQWLARGSLPRTEYTGETKYAATIAKAAREEFTAAELLDATRRPVLTIPPLCTHIAPDALKSANDQT